ncbi:MAG: hypothetical protein WA865_19505 [Spirulinaceae cyanobacterium]
MSALNPTTKRRLKKIPQINSVWEGDCRPLSILAKKIDPDAQGNEQCIIWVDGSEGIVRAMDLVSPEMGQEAIVRTLLRAIETPQSPASPARPQKIILRDREIQFLLRGVLQGLDISVDYVPQLPVIEEFFHGIDSLSDNSPPTIPSQYQELLWKTAEEIWQEAPWEVLADHNIIAIKLNRWDTDTLYVSVMGMLGREYGVLFYRSLESLRRFRAAVVAEESLERLESAFLAQDCWFVNFEFPEEELETEDNLVTLNLADAHPRFGSIHPYEGMRPFLDEEEALVVYVALKALARFMNKHYDLLDSDDFEAFSKSYRIPLPEGQSQKTVAIEVSTMPELSSELFSLMEQAELDEFDSEEEDSIPLQSDLIPEDAWRSLGMVSPQWLEAVRKNSKKYYQSQEAPQLEEGMPAILVQTSLPKAKAIMEQIKADGGLKAICFNPGEDPSTETNYELGMLQAANGNLYLFGEFVSEDPAFSKDLWQWQKNCQSNKNYCSFILARGLRGASRGNPQISDLVALFEVKVISAQELGIGMLQLTPQISFELDW